MRVTTTNCPRCHKRVRVWTLYAIRLLMAHKDERRQWCSGGYCVVLEAEENANG